MIKYKKKENEIISYARQELSKLDYLTLYLTPNVQKPFKCNLF